jgi:hypothetical protein
MYKIGVETKRYETKLDLTNRLNCRTQTTNLNEIRRIVLTNGYTSLHHYAYT